MESRGGVTIQLNLTGLVIFSIALVLASALVTYGLVRTHGSGPDKKQYSATSSDGMVETEATIMPPWGQLSLHDIDLEQPEEYVAYEVGTNKVAQWNFDGMSQADVRATMVDAGLTALQVERALSPACMTSANGQTVIMPDSDLVLSMRPEQRAKLYTVLARFSSNELIQYPFVFPGNSFSERLDKANLRPETISIIQSMLYPRGDAQCFSDLAVLLKQLPDDNERLQTVKALSHQSAVLMGIHVWPDSDIDKIIGYWSWPSGVRLIDVRPLLESLKRKPNGGAASILYFLPQFARQRLYTYPLPSRPGDSVMDCHWSTMNFFNGVPDNRFSDPKFTADYLLSHYYTIAKPTAYGDLVFLLDKNGNAIHSAVYLADDIVFTKNGNNFAQPWMLMHLKDLISEYTTDVSPRLAIYRNRNS
jgi:hypothetical protein